MKTKLMHRTRCRQGEQHKTESNITTEPVRTIEVIQRFSSLITELFLTNRRLFSVASQHNSDTLGTHQRLPVGVSPPVHLGQSFLSSISALGMPDVPCCPPEALSVAQCHGTCCCSLGLLCCLGIKVLGLSYLSYLSYFLRPHYHQGIPRIPRQVRKRTGDSVH